MNTDLPPLNPSIAGTEPWGRIRFVHEDREHEFYSIVNSLTGDRLTAFDTGAPSVGDSVDHVKRVFRNIWGRAEVTAYGGSLARPAS